MAGGTFLASIPWDKLFAFAEKMFANCNAAGVPPAEQEQNLRNPPARIRMKVERVTERGCKRNGMTVKEWRKNKDAIMERVYAEGRDATKAEINQLRQRAKLVDPSDDDDDEEDLFND